MKPENIMSVVARYRVDFETRSIHKINWPLDEKFDSISRALEHCHSMLEEIEEFVANGLFEDANCWLGFVQGVLAFAGWYTIEDFRKHNGTGGIQH